MFSTHLSKYLCSRNKLWLILRALPSLLKYKTWDVKNLHFPLCWEAVDPQPETTIGACSLPEQRESHFKGNLPKYDHTINIHAVIIWPSKTWFCAIGSFLYRLFIHKLRLIIWFLWDKRSIESILRWTHIFVDELLPCQHLMWTELADYTWQRHYSISFSVHHNLNIHDKASKTETLDLCQLPHPPYEIHKKRNLPASLSQSFQK